MFTVTSAFKSLSESQNPSGVNVGFVFSGSSDPFRVLGAANIRRSSGKFTAGNMRIDVANTQVDTPTTRPSYNILRTDKTHFFRNGQLGVSFIDSGGTDSGSLTLFTGKLTTAQFKENKVSLTFLDIFETLNKLPIGSDEDPIQFVDSDWNPADMFWTIATSWGRLNDVASTSNPDIDYASFTQWSSDMDDLPITLEAEFKGLSVVEAFNKISKMSNSVIVGEGDGKIYCYSNVPMLVSSKVTLTSSYIFDLDLVMDTKDINNAGTVYYDYDPNSTTFAGSVTAEETSSINTYGRHELIFQETIVWHSNKVSADNFLKNKIALSQSPLENWRVSMGYIGLRHQLNDQIDLTDAILSLDTSKRYGITAMDIDVDNGKVIMSMRERFGNEWFFLDVDSADGGFGLLDETYNPLY